MLLQQPFPSALPVSPPSAAVAPFEDVFSTILPSYHLAHLTYYVDWPLQGNGDMALSLWSAPRHLAPALNSLMPLPGDMTLPAGAGLPTRIWSPLLHTIFVPQQLARKNWLVQATASWRATGPSTPPPPRFQSIFASWTISPVAHNGNHGFAQVHFPWGMVGGILPAVRVEPEMCLAFSLVADDITVDLSLDFNADDDPRTLAAFEANAPLAVRTWASGPEVVPNGWQAQYRTKDMTQKWGLVRFLSLSNVLVTLRIESPYSDAVCEAAQSLTPALEPLVTLACGSMSVR